MKTARRLTAVLIALVAGALPACAPGEGPGGEGAERAPDAGTEEAVASDRGPAAELPEPDAEALWAHLGDESYAGDWALWPGKGELYEGAEPHGARLTTYVSPAAADAFETDAAAMPYGAIVVKENYSADGVLQAITVMYKVADYNPDAGDWFWARYLPDGSVDGAGALAGTPASCIECHSSAAENDFLRTGPIGSVAGGARPQDR